MKEIIGSKYKLILSILAIVGVSSIVLSYLLKTSLIIFSMISMVGSLFVYAYARDNMSEDDVLMSFISLMSSISTGILSIVHHTIYLVVYKKIEKSFEDTVSMDYGQSSIYGGGLDYNQFGAMNEGMASMSFVLSGIINVVVVFFMVIYISDKKRKEKVMTLKEMSISKLKGGDEKVASEEEPDILLCKDAETGKNVIWPHKDRYVHMLVLGPTGSGKTSQSIIPMIYQDMKKKTGITVLDPKGDLAEKVWAMAKLEGRDVIYFNTMLKNGPRFNPLFGNESDVIESMTTTFKMLAPDSSQFFLDQNENLLRNGLKVLKRLEKGKPNLYAANLITLNRFLQDINGEGRKMVLEFSRLPGSDEIMKENADISAWFLNDYFTGASGSGGRGGTKTYEHTSGVRTQIAKIISNKYLRKALNPPLGVNDIDFEEHLAKGGVIAMSTAQGDLRELGKTLGLFLVLQFQAAVFRFI